MKAQPSVSVIIPTKNEEKNISRCLESVIKQKYQGKIEIIVVDNHSKDKTVALAKKFTRKVFVQGHERSRQRNFGAKKAIGKYFFFLDADMELTPKVIKECVKMAEEDPSPISIDELAVGHTFLGKALALERNCYRTAKWLNAARFYPGKEFLKAGGYDEKLVAGEDWDLHARLKKKFDPQFMDSCYLIHHEPEESLLQFYKSELYYIKHIRKYIKKNPGIFSQQKDLKYRLILWLKHWKDLLRHPLLTLTFLFLKFTVWLMWKFNKSG